MMLCLTTGPSSARSLLLNKERRSCPELVQGDERGNEFGRDFLCVDTELANRDVLTQVALMHTAKRTQEITHACPQTFNRIDMHFAHAIAIVITRPFALPMRASRMLALQARIAAPFVGIHIRARTCTY